MHPSRAVAVVLLAVATTACSGPSGPAQAAPPRRLMAITVDDLPIGPPGRHDTREQERITARLLAALAGRGVRAVGFVNESRLEVDGEVVPRRVDLLRAWLDAGHELGNHGYAHLDLHRVAPEAWMDDVLRGERILRPLVAEHGGRLRWFRHPFLHTGRSREVQERTAAFLAAHGYRIAPVTIDNGEWLYGRAYAAALARGDAEFRRRLGEDYLRYMIEVVDYYERQSEAIVGREVPQILLVHAYALNADWLGALLGELARRGWRWTTLEEALADPAFGRPTHGYVGAGGITWLHRWAITAGLPPSTFAGEPEVPRWVEEAPGVEERAQAPYQR
jgi:peptidoglycan/xylan/chitin deacetylase (PgdA/CDA1 family)